MTPWTVARQAPLSMGFPKQEYWSGLPFPSPGDFPDPWIKPTSSALQADSLPSEPPGKLKNTALGSLSLLQGIFPIQESNWGILHCRWILCQLSYEGSLGVPLKEALCSPFWSRSQSFLSQPPQQRACKHLSSVLLQTLPAVHSQL